MRKFITLLLTLTLMVMSMAMSHPLPARADANIRTAVFTIGSTTYTVNGQQCQMDVAPVVVNGRTLMPARYLAYSLGIPDSGIKWQKASTVNNQDWEIDLTRTRADGSSLSVGIIGGNPDPKYDFLLVDNQLTDFDTPPESVPPGRVMVPYRCVAQALGAIVSWDGTKQQVTITTWYTLPAIPSGLTASQVLMQPNSNTIAASENGTQLGQWTYPYPVDIADPCYPTAKDRDLVAVIPTLEAFGVPSDNILWDPDSQTLAVAGNCYNFLYITAGSNTNITDEFCETLIDPSYRQPPNVVIVENGVLYGDATVAILLSEAFGVNSEWNYPPSNFNGINIIN